MPTNISWKLNLEIQSGQADAYDRIEVKVPDSTPAPTATTVDMQPGAAGKVKLLLIRSTKYGDNLKYKVHDNTTSERVLNDAVFLVGAGQPRSAGEPHCSAGQTARHKHDGTRRGPRDHRPPQCNLIPLAHL
jgi:hypothetical protein